MSSDQPPETQPPAEPIKPDRPAQENIDDRGAKTDLSAATTESGPAASAPSDTSASPQSAAQPVAAPTSPSIAERVSVPAQAPADDGGVDGGEWEMLSDRIGQFFKANNLQEQWQSLRQPLLLLGGLIVVILTMRIYGGILDAIATVPLAPRLFQLVGTFYAVWFAATRLIRAEERKKISANVNDLWTSLRGSSKS